MRHGFFRLACCVLLVLGMAPSASPGFDLEPELLVYLEDFEGEVSFPTAPEVDEIGAGGMEPFGEPPMFGGGVATAIVDPGDPSSFAITSASDLEAGAIVARGSFAGLSAALDDVIAPTIQIGFASNESPDNFVTAFVGLIDPTSGDAIGEFRVQQSDGITFWDIAIVPLTVPQADALLAGVPFTLDLALDLFGLLAQGSLEIDGFSPIDTAAVALPVAVTNPDLDGSVQGLGLFPGGSGTSQIDFEEHTLHRFFRSSFTVDTTADAVDANVGDGSCQTAAAECSLRAAIQESNAIAGAGEIVLPAATYILSLAGAEEDLAATGDLDIDDHLVLRGGGASTTIVDGGGIDRVFEILFDDPLHDVHLEDLTIRNGSAATAGGDTGGGIENHGALTLERCVVADNVANLAGGIMNRGTLLVDDCVVRDNEAQDLGFTNDKAGGIASASTSAGGSPNVHATIRNSAIVDNLALEIGGVEFGNCGSAHVENTTISGNDDDQLVVNNCDVSLAHVTIAAPIGRALRGFSFDGSHTVGFVNTAIEGAPACSLGSLGAAYAGNNASNDTSCGFSGAGSIEGTALGLAPLAPLASSRAHLPEAGSPLRDAAAAPECLESDQVGTARPVESDGAGGPECEIGAIEVPEPGSIWMLAGGGALVAALGRRRSALAQR